MPVAKNSPGYQVDRRVSIGIDALDKPEQDAISSMIADRERFMTVAADSRKVRKLSKDRPLYSLRGPADLRILFTKVNDEIVVTDLMRQVTLDRLRPKRSKPKASGSRQIRKRVPVKEEK